MQLFHDSWPDALREIIAACGGPKAVAARLWHEKSADAAHRLLLDCLNDTRAERLDPDRLRLLLRMGREANCHAGINWLLRDLGYEDARAIEPEDERAQLMRAYVDATRSLKSIAERIDMLGGPLHQGRHGY